MDGNHPKRRKDKYNPYSIAERNGKFYMEFLDGMGKYYTFQIDEQLYEQLNKFELEDLRYMNTVDRHLEQSEIWESSFNERALWKPKTVEDIVFENFQKEELHKAIKKLPEIQRRRLVLYYFKGMTYERIAEKERCTKMAVKNSVDKAIGNLRKILE